MSLIGEGMQVMGAQVVITVMDMDTDTDTKAVAEVGYLEATAAV